jgi:hypothetical protein
LYCYTEKLGNFDSNSSQSQKQNSDYDLSSNYENEFADDSLRASYNNAEYSPKESTSNINANSESDESIKDDYVQIKRWFISNFKLKIK